MLRRKETALCDATATPVSKSSPVSGRSKRPQNASRARTGSKLQRVRENHQKLEEYRACYNAAHRTLERYVRQKVIHNALQLADDNPRYYSENSELYSTAVEQPRQRKENVKSLKAQSDSARALSSRTRTRSFSIGSNRSDSSIVVDPSLPSAVYYEQRRLRGAGKSRKKHSLVHPSRVRVHPPNVANNHHARLPCGVRLSENATTTESDEDERLLVRSMLADSYNATRAHLRGLDSTTQSPDNDPLDGDLAHSLRTHQRLRVEKAQETAEKLEEADHEGALRERLDMVEKRLNSPHRRRPQRYTVVDDSEPTLAGQHARSSSVSPRSPLRRAQTPGRPFLSPPRETPAPSPPTLSPVTKDTADGLRQISVSRTPTAVAAGPSQRGLSPAAAVTDEDRSGFVVPELANGAPAFECEAITRLFSSNISGNVDTGAQKTTFYRKELTRLQSFIDSERAQVYQLYSKLRRDHDECGAETQRIAEEILQLLVSDAEQRQRCKNQLLEALFPSGTPFDTLTGDEQEWDIDKLVSECGRLVGKCTAQRETCQQVFNGKSPLLPQPLVTTESLPSNSPSTEHSTAATEGGAVSDDDPPVPAWNPAASAEMLRRIVSLAKRKELELQEYETRETNRLRLQCFQERQCFADEESAAYRKRQEDAQRQMLEREGTLRDLKERCVELQREVFAMNDEIAQEETVLHAKELETLSLRDDLQALLLAASEMQKREERYTDSHVRQQTLPPHASRSSGDLDLDRLMEVGLALVAEVAGLPHDGEEEAVGGAGVDTSPHVTQQQATPTSTPAACAPEFPCTPSGKPFTHPRSIPLLYADLQNVYGAPASHSGEGSKVKPHYPSLFKPRPSKRLLREPIPTSPAIPFHQGFPPSGARNSSQTQSCSGGASSALQLRRSWRRSQSHKSSVSLPNAPPAAGHPTTLCRPSTAPVKFSTRL